MLIIKIIRLLAFLFYSLSQYLRVYQTLPNALRGLFGLAWIILFFQKVLKIKS
ncbi:MAG: hypothetical protein EHV01_003700 [Spiroplasma sp. hy2]|uniref:hypothetical protein n=1 Tax=Spiroplasma sp. hy2 TaxID=2490850 RepID=UPI003B456FA3